MEKDLLQVKTYQALSLLSKEARDAIESIPWRSIILTMRETKGYSFEQLNSLEIETELLLCGLESTEGYLKEIETRMKITEVEANSLVNQMNELIFKKMRRKLVENLDKVGKKLEKPVNEESEQNDLLNKLAYSALEKEGRLVNIGNYKESPEYKNNQNKEKEPTVESINKERAKNIKLSFGKNLNKATENKDISDTKGASNNQDHDKILKSAGIEILSSNTPLELEIIKEPKEISAPKVQA